MIPERKKYEYWNHFVEQWIVERVGGAHGMTGARLRKVKPTIWRDEFFWRDVILRHDALHNSPEHLREYQPDVYGHCLGNFWGMIVQTMIEEGLLK